jgi:hypothetical protein
MLTRLLAVALLAPTLALAQDVPPQAAPPGAMPVYPATPVEPPAAPRQGPAVLHRSPRDSWYIGFGLGTGSGNTTWQSGDSLSFSDLNGNRDTTNVLLNFKVGATLSPTLLLGFDWTVVRASASDEFADSYAQIANYDAMLTWFPWETGFLLRGGAGLSALTLKVSTAGASGTDTYTGANVLVGAGYAFWLGDRFNLTLGLDVSAQGYGDGAGSPKSSALWALWAGADWY